jgi:histidinol-phosphate/aromatic aminotransferase/cobyric acid decarboxylase-like protein
MKIPGLRQTIAILLAVSTCLLAGCAGLPNRAPAAQQAAIQAVFSEHARLNTQGERANLLSDQRVANLMAIDVQGCPTDFRSAWYDYLVQVRNLHRRTDRVTNLPGLIKVAVGSPELGQYLLDALSQEDAAWEKLERSAMNNGVMPKP